MLKKLVNEAHLTLRITTTGPVLIKSGLATVSGPDMSPVLTYRNGRQEVYLPGSSLKGVFRSHIEKIVCSLKPRVACYPFSGNEKREADLTQRRRDYRDSCGAVMTELAKKDDGWKEKLEDGSDLAYRNSCPICRLFGSTYFIGRLAISDAYLVSQAVLEQRDGVGIDRLTGGASHGAKFELEVVGLDVAFETTIHLRNFEVWQLGMLFVVLQDMEDELIRIGSGRSRGLGRVTARISEEEHHGFPGGFVTSTMRGREEEPAQELWGLGRWLDTAGRESYGVQGDDWLTLKQPVQRIPRGIRNQRVFQDEALYDLREQAIKSFMTRMQSWPQPEIPLQLADR